MSKFSRVARERERERERGLGKTMKINDVSGEN